MDRPKLKFLEVTKSRHGKPTVYFRRNRGQRVRLPDFGSKDFRQCYYAALREKPIPHVRDMPPTISSVRVLRTEKTLRRSLSSALQRSKQKDRQFSLSLEWALEAAKQQNYRCALTGIEFYWGEQVGSRHPYTPSLDRMNPRGGYTVENTRIVCLAINTMLMDWGQPLFEQVANSYRYWQRTKRAQSIPAPCTPVPAPENEGN